jgi:hypothetical protein
MEILYYRIFVRLKQFIHISEDAVISGAAADFHENHPAMLLLRQQHLKIGGSAAI